MDDAQFNGPTRFFDEAFLHPKASALDAPAFVEFDWEALRRQLGEAEEQMSPRDYAAMGSVIGELLRWIVKGDKIGLVGRRAVALAWVIDPRIFKGCKAPTVAARYRFNPVRMLELATQAKRSFGVKNRAQRKPRKHKRRNGASQFTPDALEGCNPTRMPPAQSKCATGPARGQDGPRLHPPMSKKTVRNPPNRRSVVVAESVRLK